MDEKPLSIRMREEQLATNKAEAIRQKEAREQEDERRRQIDETQRRRAHEQELEVLEMHIQRVYNGDMKKMLGERIALLRVEKEAFAKADEEKAAADRAEEERLRIARAKEKADEEKRLGTMIPVHRSDNSKHDRMFKK